MIENKGSEKSRGNPNWVKNGASPNPGGRPKAVRELLELARTGTKEALELAMGFLSDVELDPRVRLDAAKFIASYGLGRPPSLEIEEESTTSTTLRPEIAARLAALES